CDDSPSKSGVACAGMRCQSGEVCCIDCNGRGSCGAPGFVCAGPSCLPDAGTDGGAGSDGGTGTQCGQLTCAGEQVCCIDCNGRGMCGPPGTHCTGGGCGCGTPGQACCTQGAACQTGLNCCAGVPYPTEGVCLDRCGLQSDRNLKQELQSVDPHEVLRGLSALPGTTWSYVGEGPAARPMGPMAQAFHERFGLGASDRRL